MSFFNTNKYLFEPIFKLSHFQIKNTMPLYHKLGNIPPKRHTQFEKPTGGLYYEQLFGTEGFHGHSSLLYHVHRPTQLKEISKSYSVEPKIAIGKNLKSLLLKGFELKPEDDFLDSRKAMLVNRDCIIGLAAPRKSLISYFDCKIAFFIVCLQFGWQFEIAFAKRRVF